MCWMNGHHIRPLNHVKSVNLSEDLYEVQVKSSFLRAAACGNPGLPDGLRVARDM